MCFKHRVDAFHVLFFSCFSLLPQKPLRSSRQQGWWSSSLPRSERMLSVFWGRWAWGVWPAMCGSLQIRSQNNTLDCERKSRRKRHSGKEMQVLAHYHAGQLGSSARFRGDTPSQSNGWKAKLKKEMKRKQTSSRQAACVNFLWKSQ